MKTVPALLRLDPDVAAMLEAAAIKLRCSKSAVVEALIRIECGLPTDDPIAEWFKSRGARSTGTDYRKLTEADLSAKRPRGARVAGKAAQGSITVGPGSFSVGHGSPINITPPLSAKKPPRKRAKKS